MNRRAPLVRTVGRTMLSAGLAAMVAIGAAVAPAPAMAQSPTLNPIPNPFQRYCSDGRADALVFLIDQTERYDTVDRNRLADGAIAMLNGLRYGQRFAIYRLDNTPGDLTPSLDICVPGCPEDYNAASDGSIWQHTCDRITIQREKQQFLQIFRSRFADLLDSSEDTGGTELLRTLSTLSFEFQSAKPDRLVIFSDMIEYSSLSRKVNGFTADFVEELIQRAQRRAPQSGAFQGVPVDVFGFGKRLGQLHLIEEKGALAELPYDATQALRTYWLRYFDELVGAGPVQLQLNYPHRSN